MIQIILLSPTFGEDINYFVFEKKLKKISDIPKVTELKSYKLRTGIEAMIFVTMLCQDPGRMLFTPSWR